MAWFYGFGPDKVNALTMYQLQGYISQISIIHKMLNGMSDDGTGTPQGPAMTDDELMALADQYGVGMKR